MNKAIPRALLTCLWLSLMPSPARTVEPVKDEVAGVWPIERLKSEVPAFQIEDAEARVQSIIYEGEKIGGKPTGVFAFYASPVTLGVAKEGETFPGIVLIHGGGGTAFSDWVWL